MFNLSGSELIFLVLIALVVLGPDKLPEAMRKAGKAYAEFKKMTTGFQSEMKSVLDEPMRELRETAELAKKSAMFDINGSVNETAAAAKAAVTPVKSAEPVARTPPGATPPRAKPPVSTSANPPTISADTDASASNTPTVEDDLADLEVRNAPVSAGTMQGSTPGSEPAPTELISIDSVLGEATPVDATSLDPRIAVGDKAARNGEGPPTNGEVTA